MKVCGIVAEYNPLHFGHIYHIKNVKKIADAIVVVLSGHLMQRGEFAIFNKWARTTAALKNGADLIIELPAIFSSRSAEVFAISAMKILKELNCIDMLSFGSECGQIEKLMELAKNCQHIDKTKLMQKFLKKGFCYPKARKLAIKQNSSLLNFPNNSLGIEYIKACYNLNFDLQFHTIKRIGAFHDSKTPKETASSSYIRNNICKMKKYIPENILNLFNDPIKIPKEILFYNIRNKTTKDFKKLPDVTEGLENRLTKAAKNSTNLDEFFKLAKTKRYTMSRLRRIVIYSFLNFEKDKLPKLPEYAHVLGFNETGQKLLSTAKKNSNILISSNFKNIAKNFSYSASKDAIATDTITIFQKHKKKCGEDYRRKPIIISKTAKN